MSFKCEQCERVFAKKSKLNRHVRETHMNIKQYVCEECGKNFKRNSHLKRHLISHSENPKPHKCSYEGCYMAFTCKHHLERHIKIIHIEEYQYKCTECDAKFPKKVSLNKHLTYDHGKKKPLTCQLCHKSFFKLGQLEYHHCEEKFKQLNLELETVGANPNIMMQDLNVNDLSDNQNHAERSQGKSNLNNIEAFQQGLVHEDSMFQNQMNSHHIPMLHDDQHHEPNNIPVIDISQFSRKRQRNYNYANTDYSTTSISQNNNDLNQQHGSRRNQSQGSKISEQNINSTQLSGPADSPNTNSTSNILSNRIMNSNSAVSLNNQIQPPIKKKFKPDYLENQNFSLSGDQQPISSNIKQQNLINASTSISDQDKQQKQDNANSQSVDVVNRQKIIKISFDGLNTQSDPQDQYTFKEKNVSFSNPSLGVNSQNQGTGLLMPEVSLQATLNEQSKITESFNNKVPIKVEEPSTDKKKEGVKSSNDLSEQQQQQQQQQLNNNQGYYESMNNEVNRDYMHDPKQEYDTINLDMNNQSDIHGNFGNQGMQNIGQGNLYEQYYKSPSIRPNGRKLSELFTIHDFKERKNSFNSDYGNLTIFKDLFQDNSFNSRRPSMNIPESKNYRKGSIFHLQKMEEDGIIVDLDINQGDMNNMINTNQSQEIHHNLQSNYDQMNSQSANNTNLNSNAGLENNYANQSDQMIGNNSQQFIQNSTILSQLSQSKTEQSEGQLKAQQRINHHHQMQNNRLQQPVQKQGYTSNNPQLHHHIYQQREVSPQMQFNPDSAKVGYAHSPYIPLVVRSKSPSNKIKKEEKCYKCNYADCDKFYTKLSNLKTHIRTFHFKSKDFKCNYQGCKSAYLHKKSLKEHIARVHKSAPGAYIPGSKRNSEDYEYSDEHQMNQLNQNQLKEILPKIQYDEHDHQQILQQSQQQISQQQQYHISHQNHHLQNHHQQNSVQPNDLLANHSSMYGLYIPSPNSASQNASSQINYHQQFTQQQQQQQQQQQLHHNSFSSSMQNTAATSTAPFYSYQNQPEYVVQHDAQLQIPLLQSTQSQQQQYQPNYPQLHRNLSLPTHHSQQTKSSVFMA